MKVLYTATLAITFMFIALFSLYAYGIRIKKKAKEELDGLLTGCAILFYFVIIFGSISLAVWIVF